MATFKERLGCKVYGHHPWVAARTWHTIDEENALHVWASMENGECRRCGADVPRDEQVDLVLRVLPAELTHPVEVISKIETFYNHKREETS